MREQPTRPDLLEPWMLSNSGLSSPPLRSSDGQIEAIVETPIGFTAPHLVEDLLELFVQRGG
jgi:hypothetical protein